MENELLTLIGPNSALRVDNSMKITGKVHWTDAVTSVVTERASAILNHPTEIIRSKNLTIPRPLVVMTHTFSRVHVFQAPYDAIASKKGVLLRDNYVCAYCGGYGDTVDHIDPKSRGGGNNWGNLCAACRSCNSQKDNKTPEEIGFKRPKLATSYVVDNWSRYNEALYSVFS